MIERTHLVGGGTGDDDGPNYSAAAREFQRVEEPGLAALCYLGAGNLDRAMELAAEARAGCDERIWLLCRAIHAERRAEQQEIAQAIAGATTRAWVRRLCRDLGPA